MIYMKDNEMVLPEEKIIFTRGGMQREKEIGEEGKSWWLDFETKWEDMKIISFETITYTQEQLNRLEEVKVKNLANTDEVSEYVLNNIIADDKQLEILNLKKVIEQLVLDSLGV